MNKKSIIAVVLAVIVLLGAGTGLLLKKQSDDSKNAESSAMLKKDEETKAMKAKEEALMATPKDDTAMSKETSNDVMKKEDTADMTKMQNGTGYITLADYQKDTTKYSESKKVYFFHASWCSICQSIDKSITSDLSKIPANTVIIKTDFDTSTELRQKYGVTVQYTFVQFDNSGNRQAKWSATDYDKVIAGII